MSSVTLSPSKLAVADQAADRKGIEEAAKKAVTTIGVVGAQTGVAEGGAKSGLGTEKTKKYLGERLPVVTKGATDKFRCAAADYLLNSIKAIEPAESESSPLVEGAKQTLGTAEKSLSTIAGASAAVGERIKALPVNLNCEPPKDPPKGEAKKS
jgi:hypothetical protein